MISTPLNLKTTFWIITVSSFVFCVCFLLHLNGVLYSTNGKYVVPKLLQTNKSTNILTKGTQFTNISNVKTMYIENKPRWLKVNDSVFQQCDIKTCKFSRNIPKSDAILIYMVEYHNRSPPKRNSNQVWILFGFESPHHVASSVWSLPVWSQQINWTMTYRLDSTIPVTYGRVYRSESTISETRLQVILKKKTKSVAWVVSNCRLIPSKRDDYVKLLQKHLKLSIDIYGKCGTLTANKDIFKTINETYKFYLAFENSLCKDYVTEKFIASQNMDVIVVARGDGNYSHFYPKGSYIDTRDFATTKDLASYIEYLDKNDTAYLEILRKKMQYYSIDGVISLNIGFCDICSKLHQPLKETFVPDIHHWWQHQQCRQPSDLI